MRFLVMRCSPVPGRSVPLLRYAKLLGDRLQTASSSLLKLGIVGLCSFTDDLLARQVRLIYRSGDAARISDAKSSALPARSAALVHLISRRR